MSSAVRGLPGAGDIFFYTIGRDAFEAVEKSGGGERFGSMRETRSAAKGMYAASMVIFGTLGLFTRHIPVSSGELALYRAVLAFLLVGLFLVNCVVRNVLWLGFGIGI